LIEVALWTIDLNTANEVSEILQNAKPSNAWPVVIVGGHIVENLREEIACLGSTSEIVKIVKCPFD
jgi:hypothetical protein